MADATYAPKVYRKAGGDELVVASGGLITVESGGSINASGQTVATASLAGAGFTTGTGTIYKTAVSRRGDLYVGEFWIDLTGLGSSTTDLDIIGVSTTPAYFALLNTAQFGATIHSVTMTCEEAPAGGVTDIDMYSATEGTGKFDDAVTGLTETAIITSGGAWTNGATKAATTVPLATEYLYLTGGAGGTAATYTAGKFKITVVGY